MKKPCLIICASVLAASLGAQGFSGSVGSGARFWFGSSDIPVLPQTFDGLLKGPIGDPEAPSGQYQVELRVSHDPVGAGTTLDLGRSWIKAYFGPLDLTAGSQVVAWGSTDVFNPVDIVNPLDLSFPADQEGIPLPMARAQLALGAFSLDLVALPWWRATVLPAGLWARSPGLPTFSNPALAGKAPVITYLPVEPAASWENTRFAGRLALTFDLSQGLDLGLSYYRGFATTPSPSFALGTPGATSFPVTVSLNYYRLDQAGLDFAWALDGGLLVKGEAAYRVLDETNWFDPAPSRASAEGVGGLEYTILGVKTVGEYVADWTRGASGEDDLLAQTLVLALNAEPDSRLSLKAVGAYDLEGSGLVSGQATYTLADGLKAGLRLFGFFGDPGTRYGDWSGNGFGDLTLTYSF